MMANMMRRCLPPGFRFQPSDEELVAYYVKGKVMGRPLRLEIAEIDLYKFAPWDLPEKSCLQSKDLEWYFFCPRNSKYPNGRRTNRATEIGFWKTTGKDKSVYHNSHTIGMKKTLVFHVGRAPNGRRTDWVMHEYRLEDHNLLDAGISQDAFVICKIFQKSGLGPKNGEQHGAPFEEEEWNDDEDDSLISVPFVGAGSPPSLAENDENIAMSENAYSAGCSFLPQPCAQKSGTAGDGEQNPPLPENDDVRKMLLELIGNDVGASALQDHGMNEEISAANTVAKDGVPLDGDDIFGGLEGIISDTDQNITEKLYFSCDPEGQQVLQEMLSGVYDDYLELNDLQHPIEAGGSDFGFSNASINHFDNLHGVATPGAEINVSAVTTNLEYPEPMRSSAGLSVENAAVETEHVLQDAAGDPSDASSSSLLPNSNSGVPYSTLQYLLDSIPARPAWAAECPSIKAEKSKDAFSSFGGPISVKAEVTVTSTSICTRNSSPHKSADFPCMCSYGYKRTRKVAKDPSLHDSGFTFVFLLGAVTAIMWIFLLAMGLKLGRYGWKLVFS